MNCVRQIFLTIIVMALAVTLSSARPVSSSSAFSISKVPSDVQSSMTGKSFPRSGASIKMDDLRYLRVLYVGYDGNTHFGEIVCHKSVAKDILFVFERLYEARYQIESVKLVDYYDADDNKSMAANNTSCFNYRTATGASKALSRHARGLAIDINPLQNPYVKGDRVLPPEGKPYVDRSRKFDHKITHKDICYRLFRKRGFRWGGDWGSIKDYQHFEKR